MNTKSNEKGSFVFKTNINCGGCVAKITPFLDATDGIETWTVDTENRDKILSVACNGISKNEIIDTVQKAGFKIEALD
ncbi:MAG TPA: heavy-metal-associated domain-containing protein [Flavobacterium sp.]|uniref:heavy-metal-associated domain-containing protein n=1 Tax=Flavobacterium sp. TaxID=239 RepID=UPI002DBAEA76|nr:heavy-metal-associated domain-containing protein [Flavobacterium sp.]HEU4788484.1 heavy-metal-associated domain-containing protein [Flavobacterium sp.]